MLKKCLLVPLLILRICFYPHAQDASFNKVTIHSLTLRGGSNDFNGWGDNETTLVDQRPNAQNGGAYIMNRHFGLTFSAHSYYGGIRFYNQGYPGGPYDVASGAKMAMSITDGNVGIGTTTPMTGYGNGGLHINKGAHSSIVLGNPNGGHGGFVQTSDGRHRMYLGANLYDDQNSTWRAVQPAKGAAGISLVADEGDWGTSISFYLSQDGSLKERMTLFGNGNVSIGATNGNYSYPINSADYKLYVEKGIRTRKVKVDQLAWADYVFEPTYQLPSLKDVEAFIQQNKRLPDVPSAREISENGLDLGNNQAILLKKIEELTLYAIEQDKEIQQLKSQNKELLELKKTIENITAKLQN